MRILVYLSYELLHNYSITVTHPQTPIVLSRTILSQVTTENDQKELCYLYGKGWNEKASLSNYSIWSLLFRNVFFSYSHSAFVPEIISQRKKKETTSIFLSLFLQWKCYNSCCIFAQLKKRIPYLKYHLVEIESICFSGVFQLGLDGIKTMECFSSQFWVIAWHNINGILVMNAPCTQSHVPNTMLTTWSYVCYVIKRKLIKT